MKNKKISIIGHFGGNQEFNDGQTVKTKILYEELSRKTNWAIKKVDTYYKTKKPLKLFKDTIVCLMSSKKIIVLLSGNGMKFYFPLLYFASNILGTKVYHDVIGGNLDKYVDEYPNFKKYLNGFKVNWVETDSMKSKLESRGITNCVVIPNFKRLNISYNYDCPHGKPYRFCIFSRVMKEKGVETAISAIQSINNDAEEELCKLDIFGRVDKGYQKRFTELLRKTTEAIQYKGMIPYQKSVEAISKYYALLFPTYWEGEGFPGTIVDAFSAGIPVIATDWNCNGEIIKNEQNGILYPNLNITDLKQAILWSIKHEEDMTVLKKNCIKSAKQYQPDSYIKRMIKYIENQ